MLNQPVVAVDETPKLRECLSRLAAGKERLRPLSTYRLQFNHAFRFSDARKLAGYLRELGVSTCYASPILKAQAGSMHGYDITDHNAINPELGTQEEFDELAAELKNHGMGLLLDVVPNHMGVGHGTNPWWQDVLRNGRTSKFADFFDIDWNPLRGELHNKVLLPILGDQYGEELESGRLVLKYVDGDFRIDYYDKILPVDPQTIPLIFESLGDFSSLAGEEAARELMGVLAGFSELPKHDTVEAERAVARQREAPFIGQRLRDMVERKPEIKRLLEEALRRINGRAGDGHGFDALHKLLEAQAYRLAHWRVSAEEINYRRFFDINDLVGLRMEAPRVFAATGVLIRRLLAAGTVTGLRIDHPDGLLNPPQYFARLQMLYAASQCYGGEARLARAENGIELELQNAFSQQDTARARAPLYVVVEKILEPEEDLPADWPVDGTVGYDFLNLVNGIFIDNRNQKSFTNLYQRFLSQWMDVEAIIYQSKKLIMQTALSSELNVLSHLLEGISSINRRVRDFTRSVLRDAIRETIACFPVYRTYLDERGNLSERDRGHINEAIARASRSNSSMPGSVFEFLRDILLLRGGEGGGAIYGYRKQLYFALKFQQLTGPVMAKGMEDTACYVYNRFVSVNEVGGSPKQFGIELDEFHRGNLKRQQQWRYSLLATSTHDTKRSEDVRMRLDVLSELPRLWAAQVLRWRRGNRGKKKTLSDGRTVPDANEEYLLYQTLVGTWPLPAAEEPIEEAAAGSRVNGNPRWALDQQSSEDLLARIQAYMTKAVNEAKVNMSWINPHQEYTEALHNFIARILMPGSENRPNNFLRQLEEFVPRIALFGVLNSISETLIKLTSPGVPDIYQGQELFDFSLVDPDNRRPVDFELRQRRLRELLEASRQEQGISRLCGAMLKTWSDGRLKLWVTYCGLHARREYRELFELGDYVPLQVAGEHERHVVAYARTIGQQMAVVATPRFAYSMLGGEERMPVGEAWGTTEIVLPPAPPGPPLKNLLSGEILPAGQPTLLCRDVFASFPLGLLLR
jgi:(1->4)-alpha-D-glucan 1-alpha-D-glucosylmutase